MDSKDVLQKEIVGEPVLVALGDKSYPLAFSMFAIALYKQETAKLNVRRAKEAQDSGRAKLTPDELRALRVRFNGLLNEQREKSRAKQLLDSQRAELSSAERSELRLRNEELAVLMEELGSLSSRLDEETGSGDSLLRYVNWWKIRDEDPDRIVLALWTGLHHQQDDESSWTAPFSLGQLKKLVDFSNVGEVCLAIGKAIMQHMPKADAVPNVEPQGKAADLGASEELKLVTTTTQ